MKYKTKTIKTKQPLNWNLAYYLFQMVEFPETVKSDVIFREKYDALFEYLESKVITPYDGDIKDIYVVIEQETIV
ncbi:MAG: hypothetical protein K2J89_00100 [Clostridia bacterium]|nr:hypothetical protein [Clostridia bacterium]